MNNQWIFNTPIAHRGLHNSSDPENSLSSFQNAINKNYAIELDIRLTKDKKLIVFHDKDTKRLCERNITVSESSLEELTKLSIGNSSQKIPSLKETLEFISGKTPILIEIKNEDFTGELEGILLDQLKSYEHPFAIQSFNPWSLREIKKLSPEVQTGLLSGSFKKSKLGTLSKFALKNLLLIPIIEPDFLSLELESYDGLQKSIAQLFDSKKVIFWTIRSIDKARLLKSTNKNFIFEDFEI
jgi:glycerophosphoryl diester phosphodiesterase